MMNRSAPHSIEYLLSALQESGAGGYVTNSALTGEPVKRILTALEPLQERFLTEYGPSIPAPYSAKWPVDKLHWWSRPEEYAFTLFHLLRLLKDLPTGARVLEFGPGCSFVPHALAQMGKLQRICMQDIDPNVIGFWKTVGPKVGLQVDSHEGIASGSLDIVYSVSVVEHVPNPEKAIQELVNRLAPGGSLILTMDVDLNPAGQYGLTVIQLQNILATRDIAFEPVECAAACPHPRDLATPRDGWRMDPLSSRTPGQRIPSARGKLSYLKGAVSGLRAKRPSAEDICAIKVIGRKLQ